MNSRRTSALSIKSCWLWRSSSWSWRAWRALKSAVSCHRRAGSGRSSTAWRVSRRGSSSRQKVSEAPRRSRTGRFRPGPLVTSSIVGRASAGHELACPFDLGLDRLEPGCRQPPGAPPVPGGMTNSGPLAASTIRVRGAIKRGDLGVAELFQQAEDVAIDGLAPDVVAVVEIAADADGVDPRVERRRVKGDRAAFAVAEDADAGLAVAAARSANRPGRAPSGPRSRSRAGPARRPSDRRTRGWSAWPGRCGPRRSGRSAPERSRGNRFRPAGERLANSAGTPGTRPSSCSGVWSASGITMTWMRPRASRLGYRFEPSPVTSPKAGQRIVCTPNSVPGENSATAAGIGRSARYRRCTRGSRTPRMCASRLRLGSTEALYAAGEEKSRFQYFARLAVDSSICFKRNRSTPATSSLAMSPVIKSGFVPGKGGPYSWAANSGFRVAYTQMMIHRKTSDAEERGKRLMVFHR